MTNIYVKATIRTALMVLSAFLVGTLSVYLGTIIPTEYIPFAFLGFTFVILAYVAFQINLGQLRSEETLKRLNQIK